MKRILAVVLVLTIAMGVFAGGQKDDTAEETQVLKIAHPVIGSNWSPLRGGGHEVRWQSLQWASPMYFDENGELQPYVFTEWSSNSDSTVWTFKIADNAVFSDGSPITAEDVVGTWNLSTIPSTRHERVNLFLSGVKGFEDVKNGNGSEMPGLKAKGADTVEVTLSAPDPIFAQKLATALIPPVKISIARGADGEQVPEWWHPDNDVVVSGPFMPESMDLDGGKVVLVRNPNFFGPTPKLNKIIITTVEDSQTATLMLQKGQMDAHTELNTPTMIQDLGAGFAAGSILAKGHQFWIDSSKKPTDDINVRKALIMAVDTNEMFSVAFPDGPNEPATQVVNKVAGVDPNYENYSYDPEGARAALAASSYGSADKLPKIMFVGISNPSHEAAAQYIAEQWRQVLGIEGTEMKPNIDSYDGPDQASIQIFRDDVGTRVPDMVSYLMGAIHSSSGNATRKMGGYANAEIDALLEEAATKGVDDPARIGLAQEAQRIFRNEYQFIPYRYDTMSKWAMPWVKNFAKNDDWQVIAPWAVEIDEAMKADMTAK
ncbi:MAG: ABC transporter substrate-binding protein [Spirochaetales bacterium]|nr:ABC transporter substrate-binding protein [Spirochaetales bacterium]